MRHIERNDFNTMFPTAEDKVKLINLYHTFDNCKQDLYSQFIPAIKAQFGVEIAWDDRERFRSWLKRIRRVLDDKYNRQEDNFTNVQNNNISQAENTLMQIEMERVKLRDQRREYRKLVAENARLEYIKELIADAAKTVAKSHPLVWQKQLHIYGKREGVLLCSDWHYSLTASNFINKYDKDEFMRRINVLVDKTIEYGKQNSINTLHVVSLGDLISGYIHMGIRVANSEDVVTQTQEVAEIVAQVLYRFSREFNTVKFYSVLDNHSRTIQNKNDSISKESFARFIPWYVDARLSHIENVEIVNNKYDDEIAVFDVCGNTCFAVHGDKDNIKNVAQNLSMMLKKFPDYIFTAHVHHNVEDEVHGCEIVVNPSLCGTDAYAMGIRKSSKPQSKFLVFNEQGREITYHILLN